MSLLPFAVVDNIRCLYDVDEIYDFINSGTYASVYRAVRKQSDGAQGVGQPTFLSAAAVPPGTVVALKVIQKAGIKTEKDARDIINEVAVLKCVHHPNVVKLLEVFQTNREVCFALEFVDGKELLQGLGPSRVLTEARTKCLMHQILSALVYLHEEKHVVHRDLKPENILVNNDDHLTIVDFGLAKLFGHRMRPNRLSMRPSAFLHSTPSDGSAEPNVTLLRSTSIESVDSITSHTDSPILATPCGTLKYAAPEAVRTMANHGAQWSTTRGSMPKLDMYSCGIIAYILLSGQLPYDTKNKMTLAVQMDRGPSFQTTKWETRSEAAKDFISRLLVADPALRMSAADACQHPWLRRNDDESAADDGSSPCGATTTSRDEEDTATGCNANSRNQLSVAFQALMPACSGQSASTSNETPPTTSCVVRGPSQPSRAVSYF